MARFTASRRLEYALLLCLYILYVYTFEKMKSVSLAAYLFLGDMEGKSSNATNTQSVDLHQIII